MDSLMIYRNEPSIIIGKHQNSLAEINLNLAKAKEIKVVRRLSGGGAVFHDLGNVNFCFIRNGEPGKLVDFVRFVKPVISFLNSLQVPATIGKRNDILVHDLKISGNAEHVYRNRTLHHGTLLFCSDLNLLNHVLISPAGKFESHAVQSVRSKVANIDTFLSRPLAIESFITLLFEHLKTSFSNSADIPFTAEEWNRIHQLVIEKYSGWDWNYGYSPDFLVTKNAFIDNHLREIKIAVSKGLIASVAILPEPAFSDLSESFIASLIGLPLDNCCPEPPSDPGMREEDKKQMLEIYKAFLA